MMMHLGRYESALNHTHSSYPLSYRPKDATSSFTNIEPIMVLVKTKIPVPPPLMQILVQDS